VNIRTLGIEEEFLLFRRDEPRLVDAGPAVVADADRASDDDAQYEKELKAAQAELATAPGTDLDKVTTELAQRRADLVAAAADRGARVVASGTSPVGSHSDTTDVERYHEMAEQFGAVERRQLTCAMHVHVEIDSDDEGVRVADRIGPWLPVLTALSANSPFHNARDTGYASYRRVVWGEWPTSGPAGPFADADDYHRTVRDLIATGAARDDGMIYFDVRLSANFPTLEVRICDVTRDVEDAAALAALCRGLVSTAADDDHAAPARVELLRAAHWRAARYGMTERLVDLTNGRPRLVPAWDLAHALADHTAAALEAAGDTDRVRSALDRIRQRGTGAERQRAAASEAGLAGAVDTSTLPG